MQPDMQRAVEAGYYRSKAEIMDIAIRNYLAHSGHGDPVLESAVKQDLEAGLAAAIERAEKREVVL